jgi:hypothetical protein
LALHKLKNLRATKLFPDEVEATHALEDAGKEYEIRKRPAEQIRCNDYCAALPFCEQGQRLIKETEEFRLGQMWTVASKENPTPPPGGCAA